MRLVEPAIAAVLLTPYGVCAAGVCLIIKVKLNVSSSSLERRRRKDGGPPAVPDSGSCRQFQQCGTRQHGLETYRYIVDDTVVTEFPLRRVPRGGEGVGRDVQKRTATTICDVKSSNRNYSGSIWARVRLE